MTILPCILTNCFLLREMQIAVSLHRLPADLLIKGIKTNNIDLIRFILTVLEDENTRLRSFSPGQMIAGQMLALHNAVTATFWSLNPVKYGFSEQLFAFQQEIISCQGDFEYYFHTCMTCVFRSALYLPGKE